MPVLDASLEAKENSKKCTPYVHKNQLNNWVARLKQTYQKTKTPRKQSKSFVIDQIVKQSSVDSQLTPRSSCISEGEESPTRVKQQRVVRIGEVKDFKIRSSMAKQADIQSSCQHSLDEIGKQDERLVNNSVFLPRISQMSDIIQGYKPSLKQLLK